MRASRAAREQAASSSLLAELPRRAAVRPSVRRALVPGLVGLLVVFVATGAAVRAMRGDAPPRRYDPKRVPTDGALPVGYWVWEAIERDGEETLRITDADLNARVGPDGWEGCPDRFVCTRHGIRSLAIGPTGAFHYSANVFTSSDFQHHGSLAGDDARISRRFSCAHPQWRSTPHVTASIRCHHKGDRLRVAVDPAVRGGGWPFTERDTGAWWTFRAVSRAAYYDRVLLRLCQPVRGHACDPLCYSTALVTEHPAP